MSKDSRQRMVDAAAILLARYGIDGTAFSDVLERSGAPRGSIYHHFPGGKDDLVRAAMQLVGDRALRSLDEVAGRPPREVTACFLDLWRQVLVISNLRAGCAVLAVTVATEADDLLDLAAAIFRAWRGRLADLYVQGGMARDAAARLAAVVVSASEGAVVLSRAERDLEPFDLVAEQLLESSATTRRRPSRDRSRGSPPGR